MKITKYAFVLALPLVLAACSTDKETDEERQQQLATAAQIGQAQAIAEIIERSMAQPCQPVNLFNNVDENNKKEVNLINVACESLNLPEISETDEAETSAEETE